MKKGHTYKIFVVGILSIFSLALIRTHDSHAVASTLSLSISNNSVSTSVAPTSSNGFFSKSEASTISASTNNATGYTLSISAPSNAGADYDKLINASDNNVKLNSISSATTEEQFKASNGTSYNGTWGYLPSKYCSDGTSSTCASNTDYLPAPTTVGDVLDQTNTSNSVNNSYTLALGVRVDANTAPGSYSNSYIIKMVANAIPYSISYNSVDDTLNMPTNTSSSVIDLTVAISSMVPIRFGYNFLGWCDGTITTTDGIDSCSGNIYNPNGDGSSLAYTLDQTGGSNALSLVAMWERIIQSSCASSPFISTVVPGIAYMQDIDSSNSATVMTNLAVGDTYQIKDSRDDQTYCIGKLADNRIWLLDNLALNLLDQEVQFAMLSDSSDTKTNASYSTLNYLFNGRGSFPYATRGLGTYKEYNAFTQPLINVDSVSVVATTFEDEDEYAEDPMKDTVIAEGWKVGVYYNYCAASAGSYCYNNGSSTGDATEDICPAGWRLATGEITGEYSNLANNIYGSTDTTYNISDVVAYRSALHLPLSGGIYDFAYPVEAEYQGMLGSVWTSTRSFNAEMYDLEYHGDIIWEIWNNGPRDHGYSIRCILSE